MRSETLATNRRISKALLFIISNPFCILNDIYDSSLVSKNWPDVKGAIKFLLDHNLIQSAREYNTVYFVRQFLEREQLVHANRLTWINKISRTIKSKASSDSQFPTRLEIASKIDSLYRLMLAARDLEYRKTYQIDKERASYKRECREEAIVQFLLQFRDFFSEDGNGPILSGLFKTYEELSAHLDYEISGYKDYLCRLEHNAISLKVVRDTLYRVYLQTKKDASEKEEISMKQVKNRIGPWIKPDGSPDVAKLSRDGRIESGTVLFYNPDDEVRIYNLYLTKKGIGAMPPGKKRYRKIMGAEMIYPEITFQ